MSRFELKVIAEPQDDRFCGLCGVMAQAADGSPLCVAFNHQPDFTWADESMERGGYERHPECIAAEKAEKAQKERNL